MFLSVGELICPAYHELCSTDTVSMSGQCPNSCNFNGDCVNGKCHCFLGFHGHDCSKSELHDPSWFYYLVMYKIKHDMSNLLRANSFKWTDFIFLVFLLYNIQGIAPEIVMGVENACQMGSANVKTVVLALTAPRVICLLVLTIDTRYFSASLFALTPFWSVFSCIVEHAYMRSVHSIISSSFKKNEMMLRVLFQYA